MKRKGFTLIELISVIVILAVIALIAVPIIINIISKANKSAFKDSAYGVIRSGELYYAEAVLNVSETIIDVEFIFPDDIKKLEIKGNIPSSGNMIVNKEGEIAIAISDGRYCAKKGYKDTEVSVEETKEECKTEEIANPILITDIKIKGNIEINVGEKEKIEVEYEPSNATKKRLKWTSNDKSIATVTSEGEISGIKGGNTTITATTTDGSNISKTVSVRVKQGVTKLEVNTNSLSLINGDTYQIITTIEPSTAENKELKWESSNSSIATVNSNGLITGIKGGTATITVSTTDGSNLNKTIEVTVRQQVTNITLNPTSVTVNTGASTSISATVTPDDAFMKGLKWESSNTSIATVSGGTITGLAPGTTNVTATTIDGSNISKSVSVTVKQLVTKLEINTDSVSITNGGTYTVIPTITPNNASNKTLSWTSSNNSIATVNSNGLITGVKGGTATITVSTTDGSNLSKTVEVTVRQQVTNITLSPTSVTINTGKTTTINATVTPDDAFMKGLKWESSNTSIATVSGGTITGVAPGTTTVTATTIDGSNISKTVSVTVKQLVTSLTLSQSSVSIDAGKTTTITPTISPSNASNKTLNWSSSNTSVATVNSSGLITGISKGTTTITATTTDGSNISKTVSVTVKQLVTSLTLSQSSVTIDAGKTTTITATISPSNADNKTLSWSSSSSLIATVNSSGVITGVLKGTATITATTTDGSNISKSINVTVNEPLIISSDSCVRNNTTCPNGTTVTVNVNDSQKYDFYVIGDTGTKLTLIMNQNLGGTVAWYSSTFNNNGPLTALQSLKDRTSNWTNIPAMSYTLTDDGGGRMYSAITVSSVRSRMLNYTEVKALNCSYSTCPSYLTANLSSGSGYPSGYWTSAASSGLPTSAYSMYWYGVDQQDIFQTGNRGVRPVIEISKNL